jgi:asparagine synthase (glutamine-hydrolysing)
MFSLVIYDRRDGSFVAVRDHVGKTPMYIGYGADGSKWFASEMKALADQTARFESFPPGHIYSSKTGIFTQWYKPDWMEAAIPKNPCNLVALREAFEAAVKRKMMSDVPWGVLLSGGLDSSLVASIATRFINRNKDKDTEEKFFPRLHSFCVGLPDSPDLQAAAKVAASLGTIHHSYTYTIQEGIDAIRDVIYHLETFDTTTIRASTPMFLMSRKIKV